MGYLLIIFCVGIPLIKDGISVDKVCTFSTNFQRFICPSLPYQHPYFGAPEPCSPLSKSRQTGGKVKLKSSHSPDISALYRCPLIAATLSAVYPLFDSYPQSIVTLARPIRSLSSLYLHKTSNRTSHLS